MNIRNFTILGGGISACLTALRLKKIFPKVPISVLNENISDILVNENSGSPSLVNFLKNNSLSLKLRIVIVSIPRLLLCFVNLITVS